MEIVRRRFDLANDNHSGVSKLRAIKLPPVLQNSDSHVSIPEQKSQSDLSGLMLPEQVISWICVASFGKRQLSLPLACCRKSPVFAV
jgi:hypothetical protein